MTWDTSRHDRRSLTLPVELGFGPARSKCLGVTYPGMPPQIHARRFSTQAGFPSMRTELKLYLADKVRLKMRYAMDARTEDVGVLANPQLYTE